MENIVQDGASLVSGSVNISGTSESSPQTITIGTNTYDVWSSSNSGTLSWTFNEDTGVITFDGDNGCITVKAHSGQTDNVVLNWNKDDNYYMGFDAGDGWRDLRAGE